jgi:hypothetical protein
MDLLAYIPSLLLILLVAELALRRAYKLFPWFFSYAVFGVAADISRFLTRNNRHLYFVAFWITEAIYALLGLFVLYEVLHAVFRHLSRTWWFRLIVPLTFLTALVFMAVHAKHSPPHASDRLIGWIITARLDVRFLQGLVFIVLVFLVALLGLRWRQYAFGIAVGYGFYVAGDLIAITGISLFGTKFDVASNWIRIVAYSVSVLIWLWYFRTPQKPEPPSPGIPDVGLEELQRYKKIIRRIRDQ